MNQSKEAAPNGRRFDLPTEGMPRVSTSEGHRSIGVVE